MRSQAHSSRRLYQNSLWQGATKVNGKDGQRLLSLSSKRSTLFVVDWNLESQDLATRQYRRIDL
ncbi:hypothetical protein [Nitrospira sp. Nam74]